MKHTEFRTIVGTRGWQHPEWTGTCYPDDLPPEWRLAFYANDFRGVLVPASEWQDAAPEVRAAWRDEVPEGFTFFLEAGRGAPGPAALPEGLSDALGDAFGGWVTGTDTDCPGCLATTRLETAPASTAPIVLIRAADLTDRRALGRALTALAARQPPPLALIVTDPADGEVLRELRILAELVGLS